MEQLKQCVGNGLGFCKLCESRGKWSLNWMCFLYEIDGISGCYCWECANEIISKQVDELEAR